MQVLWATVSRPDIEEHILEPGKIIEKYEKTVFKFETFRTPWIMEKYRLPFAEETNLLKTCTQDTSDRPVGETNTSMLMLDNGY